LFRVVVTLLILVRIALGLLGIGSIVIGGYALSKLGHPWLDSPRWWFAAGGAVAIAAGLGFIWYGVRGFSSRLSHSRTRHRTASGERRMGECCGMSLEAKPREALRLSGGPVRDVLTTDPDDVATREYVFALPLDVMGNLARKLTEVYERQRGTTP
jgi:hypothetical protein